MTPENVELLVAECKDCNRHISGLMDAIDHIKRQTEGVGAFLGTTYGRASVPVKPEVALPIFRDELDRTRARLAAIEATFATLKAPT